MASPLFRAFRQRLEECLAPARAQLSAQFPVANALYRHTAHYSDNLMMIKRQLLWERTQGKGLQARRVGARGARGIGLRHERHVRHAQHPTARIPVNLVKDRTAQQIGRLEGGFLTQLPACRGFKGLLNLHEAAGQSPPSLEGRRPALYQRHREGCSIPLQEDYIDGYGGSWVSDVCRH